MRVGQRIRLLSVLLSILLSRGFAASGPLHIHESGLSAVVSAKEIRLVVPVANDSAAAVSATLSVDLLDPKDVIVASAKTSEGFKPGHHLAGLALVRPVIQVEAAKDPVLWYRVRYRLVVEDKSKEKIVAGGIVALGAITPDMFELRIAHAGKALPNQAYRVRVHAANPVTRKPIGGVEIRGALGMDATDKSTLLTRSTNSAGDAILLFHIPTDATDGGSITIDARKRDQARKEILEFDLDSRARIIINTDKLLYQPGQSLHARALFLSVDKHAIAGEPATFTLLDPDASTVFTTTATTNEFGVASIDWELPDSAELGPYSLRVELANSDRYGSAQEMTNVRISRYDLPNFTVAAKPDRPYYLPGQNGSVEVSAKYLFGKELTHGAVKLVREEQRHWDSDQRKWVADESEQQSAELDHSGRAKFVLDFKKAYDELADDTYKRFEDLNYAAYVTDPSTGKTEQRRFDVRLSRDPIHVYVSGNDVTGDRASFFISTYYPDGTPAECRINVREDRSRLSTYQQKAPSGDSDFLRSIKTNRYGVAKVTDLQLVTDREDDALRNVGYQVLFDVHDKNGATASYDETFWRGSDSQILVTTDKSLYEPKDTIAVSVRAPSLSGRVIVDLSQDGAVLWTGGIGLHNHRGFTVIPYWPQFKGELTLAAYSLETDNVQSYQIPSGARTILFPSPSTLAVKIKTDRSTYKPGEDVSAALNVSLPSGGGSASALGVVVVDKAVEERIRTDEDFGEGHYGFWDWGWWYTPEAIGGVSLKDVEELDLSKPQPDGMDLVAEMLLLGRGRYWFSLPEIEASQYGSETSALFSARMRRELEPVRASLLDEGLMGWKFATSDAELTTVLRKSALDPAGIVDPWGSPYQYSFGLDYRERTVKIVSAGPDKQFGTADDIDVLTVDWPYFKPIGTMIDQVVKETYATSGAYIRDVDGLAAALLPHGVDLKTLRDPWGNPYQFSFRPSGSLYEVIVTSTGKNPGQDYYGPFAVWTSAIDYFERVRAKIDASLYGPAGSNGIFPQDDRAFDRAMSENGVNFRQVVDPWEHSYYVIYGTGSRYDDATQITYQPDATVQTSTPVTRKFLWIRIMSSGPDGKANTQDDFPVASFYRDISEQSGKDLVPHAMASVPLNGNTGAIGGVLTDLTGAVVANVPVVATLRETGQKFAATSGADGGYVVRNLPPGVYDVNVSAPGFRVTEVMGISVHSTSLTTVDVKLQVGSVSEVVEVSGEAAVLNSETVSSIASIKVGASAKVQVHEEAFTPRLRDYFPETLFWSPSLITDAGGRAKLKFKLADNITTWKMTVLATTKTGEIGVAESEIQAFQPFFLDHDPPKVLTIGDVIDLPVVVRNYLPQAQQLNVEMKPAPWFELQHPGKQQISVDAGESTTATFPFRATAMVKGGKQQVYAANRTTGDAIEKTITVHPDGLEQSATAAGILRGKSEFSLNVPANSIGGSLRAQLKIYPNLLAHVTESIEAGLERPYGCGEQTLSSTYPSVMLLKYYKASGAANPALEKKAARFVALGYHRLLSYREAGGGFSYWGHGSPDLALTAYAVRFLADASAFTDVDPEVIHNAEKWLVEQQTKEGSWHPAYGYDDGSLTAYVALTLAQAEKRDQSRPANDPHEKLLRDSVQRAFAFMADPHRGIAEPYALAQLAIAAKESGDGARAAALVAQLAKAAVPEHGGVYWVLQHNTPFYGWGHAGRVESTAMTILALAAIDPVAYRSLIDAGTLWLLHEKDQYGVWYSGQATVDVLSALLEVNRSATAHVEETFRVLGNGRSLPAVTIAVSNQDAPTTIDISEFVRAGENSIEIESLNSGSTASVQAVANYYIPWDALPLADSTRTGNPDALRLAVKFDKTEARAGDEIHCSVNAERIGSQGWGMMIAEIGLPPGADVDRRVLDEVIDNSDWTISHYDVLPDRLVLYLWPQAGGTTLTFAFRPRYGLKARTAPSILYDYYNPDAQVALTPTDFRVQAKLPAGAEKKAATK